LSFPPQFGFAVFDLRAQVFRQLGDDVLLLVLRQPEISLPANSDQ